MIEYASQMLVWTTGRTVIYTVSDSVGTFSFSCPSPSPGSFPDVSLVSKTI